MKPQSILIIHVPKITTLAVHVYSLLSKGPDPSRQEVIPCRAEVLSCGIWTSLRPGLPEVDRGARDAPVPAHGGHACVSSVSLEKSGDFRAIILGT